MRIGIDARLFGPRTAGGGLGRYIQQLITHLANIDQENEYILFLRKSNWDEFEETLKFKKVLADYQWYSLEEQLKMPQKIKEANVDLMHFPHFNVPLMNKAPFVVTIHDLILLEHPTKRASKLGPLTYAAKHAGYKKVISQALNRSRAVIVPSEYTKQSILKYFPRTDESKIKVVYEGLSRLGQEDSEDPEKDSEFLRELKIKKPFIMYVGNSYPHKNLETLVKSFARVLDVKPDLQLVLVGQRNYFSERVEKETLGLGLKVPEEVNFTGFVEDRDLAKLYRQASLYVFPSLCEGFGLPPLEAMAAGLPVASSNSSCLPEVLGSAAIYFNPKDEQDITNVILEGLDNTGLRNTLKQTARLQIKKYSWKKMANDILQIYKMSA